MVSPQEKSPVPSRGSAEETRLLSFRRQVGHFLLRALGTAQLGADDAAIFWVGFHRPSKHMDNLPSGYVKIAIEKWPFIVDFPIENGDFQ